MNNKTKLTDKDKALELEDRIIYEQSYSKSAIAEGKCGVCKRKGFPLFLVRKSIIEKNYAGISWSKNIKKLTKREPVVDLTTNEYVYRTLRNGYVYILVKNKKTKEYDYLAYEVTPSGILRHKSVENVKERNIKEIPEQCTQENHHIPGLFINIDNGLYHGDAFIAYSRRAWSEAARKIYRDAANLQQYAKLKRFSVINLDADYSNSIALSKQTLVEEEAENRSFRFMDFFEDQAKLLELELEKKQIISVDNDKKDSFDQRKDIASSAIERRRATHEFNARFVSAHRFNSLNYNIPGKDTNNREEVLAQVKRLQSLKYNTRQTLSLSVLVLEDTFGLAEELTYQRQRKIVPVLEVIAKAEEDYTRRMDKKYHNLYSSNREMHKEFDRIKKEYETKHKNEAAILNDERTGKVFETKKQVVAAPIYVGRGVKDVETTNVLSDSFLDEQYYKFYGNLSSSGIKYEYFNEKLMHLRKHKSYIDGYFTGMDDYYSKIGDKIVYDYAYSMNGVYYCFPSVNRYLKMGYKELSIKPEEKERLKKQFTGWGTHCHDVRKFSVPNSAAAEGKKLFDKEFVKYDSLLAQYRIDSFMKKEKAAYDELIKSIKEYSIDYFNYTTWLFGSSKHKSKFTPPEIKEYNEVEFWKIECDTNSSNNHIGFLADFTNIIDGTNLGNIKLDYQYGLWDILLRDENTFYYYLIKGNDFVAEATKDKDVQVPMTTFWSYLKKSRLDIDAEIAKEKQSKTNQDNQQGDESEQESIDIDAKNRRTLEYLYTKYGDKLDDRFFVEKGEHILALYQLIIGRMTSGIAQIDKQSMAINHKLLKEHFVEAAFTVGGTVGQYFQVTVPKNQAAILIKYLGDSVKTFTINEENKGELVSLPIMMSDEPPSEEVVNFEFFQHASDSFALYQEVSKVFSLDWGQFKNNFITFRAESDCLLNIFQDKWTHEVPSSRSIILKSDIAAVFLNGLAIYSHFVATNDAIEKLKTFGLGQTLRDQIIRDILRNRTDMVIKSIALLKDILDIAQKSNQIQGAITQVLNAIKMNYPMVRLMGNQIMQVVKVGSVIFSIVGAAISAYDGYLLWNKSKTKNLPAHLQSTYSVAAVLQIVAALSSLVGAIGIAFALGPIGWIALFVAAVVGVISSIYLWMYGDESEGWSGMELWFNRCLLGKWSNRHRGLPYPASFAGIAYSTNDYFVARMGLQANIEINAEHYLYKSIPIYQSGEFYGLVTNKGRGGDIGAEQATKALYIVMKFPGYKEAISDFEGTVRVLNKTTQEVAILSVSKGEEYPIIKLAPQSDKYGLFAKRGEPLTILEDDKRESQIKHKVDKIESYNPAKDKETGELLGYYQVLYKMGEFFISGRHEYEVYYQLYYWHNGNKNGNKPLLLSYDYQG